MEDKAPKKQPHISIVRRNETGGYSRQEMIKILRDKRFQVSYKGKPFRAPLLYYLLVANGLAEGELPEITEDEYEILIKKKLIRTK